MKALPASARSSCLAIAALLILSSCTSFGRQPATLTPRSEQVCDSTPPAPIPPIADTHPELEAGFRQLIGLYRDEIIKFAESSRCRAQVRAENTEAAKRAR